MEWKNRFIVNFGFGRSLKRLFSFAKSNIANVAITIATSLSAVLITSFSVSSSSLSCLENAALEVANLAKDAEEERVHISTVLTVEEAAFSDSKSAFSKAHLAVHSSFLNYSVAAFRTRNNFYNVPVTLADEQIIPKQFECSFLDCRFSISALVPSTTSFIQRNSTANKYENGQLVEKQLTKYRMETLDVYALFPPYKNGEGIPLFLPQRLAERILEANPELEKLEDCLGQQGFLEIQGYGINVYVSNILVDRPSSGDPYDSMEPDFSENDISFESYLNGMFGDFGVLYAPALFQASAVMTCADFDSEFFKIRSYLSNELRSLAAGGVHCSVSGRENREADFVFYDEQSRNLTKVYENRSIEGQFTYLDGNPWILGLGILLFVASLGFGCYAFLGKTVRKHDGELLHGAFLASAPFVILQLFSAVFVAIFSGRSALVGYSFASLSLVSVCFFLVQLIVFFFASAYGKEKSHEND